MSRDPASDPMMTDTRPIAAALSILFAMAVIGFIDNFVVVIAEHGGLWQFHFLRTLMCLPLFLAMVALGWGSLRPKRPGWVAVRSLANAIALFIYFGALGFLPVAKAASGLFTHPIWVLIFSVVFFGNRVGPIRVLAALLGFAGVLLVLQPDLAGDPVLSLAPIAAGLFYAVGAILTRTHCAGESTLTILAGSFVAMGLIGALGLGVLWVLAPVAPPGPEGFLLRGWQAPNGTFLFWTAVQAVGSLLAVWFLIRGYQIAEASFAAVFEYSLLIFVAIWGYILRGDVVGPLEGLGILLIIASGAVIALRGRDAAPAPRADTH